MSKQISTKTTIRNLTAEIKKTLRRGCGGLLRRGDRRSAG